MKKIPTPKCGPSYILGFGFHPATKEYKMVTIAAVFDGASIRFRTAISPGSVISVLTMAPSQKATEPSKPNTWRRLGLFPYHFVTQTHQVPVSGRLHWAARRKDRESRKRLVIMSFDLSDETIREVSTVLPFCRCQRNCHCRFELMVIGSCLGIAEYKVRGEIKIWVMKEYGVEDSWVNEITIDGVDTLGRELGLETTSLGNPDGVRRPSSGTYFHMISDFRVLWVLRSGEVLLEFKRRGLVLYDPMNGVLKNVLSSVGGGGFLVDGFNAIVHEGSFCDIDACMDM
ncbi:F-box protein At3g07870 [Linum grandiflorum]